MPHKRNPVLSIADPPGRAAAPQLAATLHRRGRGLGRRARRRRLARRVGDARDAGAAYASSPASQATDLLAGLRVHADRMAATLDGARDVGSEQRAMAELAGHEPAGDYLGAGDEIVDAVLDRARRSLKREEGT